MTEQYVTIAFRGPLTLRRRIQHAAIDVDKSMADFLAELLDKAMTAYEAGKL